MNIVCGHKIDDVSKEDLRQRFKESSEKIGESSSSTWFVALCPDCKSKLLTVISGLQAVIPTPPG